jgi:hypothetical protein
MTTAEIHAKVDRLLHDAEHAKSGAVMAGMMGDAEAVTRLRAKHAALLNEAHAIDPKETASAWADADV